MAEPRARTGSYYIRLAVSPVNDDEVLVANSSFFQSVDGGNTFGPRPCST